MYAIIAKKDPAGPAPTTATNAPSRSGDPAFVDLLCGTVRKSSCRPDLHKQAGRSQQARSLHETSVIGQVRGEVLRIHFVDCSKQAFEPFKHIHCQLSSLYIKILRAPNDFITIIGR